MPLPIDWEQMPYFLAVARAGSLRAAAEVLGTTHVKVNRHIGALEATYGVALIRRTQRGVTLTPAGEKLLPIAEQAEGAFEQARRSLLGLDQQMTGDIHFSLSGPLAYFIATPILAKFSEQHPDINLRVQVSTALNDPKLMKTDVSLRMIYEVTDDAIVKKLFPIGIGTFAHKDYIAENLPKAGPNGQGLRWVGAGSGAKPQWVLDSPFPEAHIRHEFSDPLLFIEAVSNGMGMARFGAFLVQKRPELKMVPGTEIEAGPPLCILIHPEMRRVARVRRFVDFLETELRSIEGSIRGISQ